ncbi:MAG TPA: asparagine synthase-related protein [Dissulfurispiraceae bacterium]|nr:asparagine synthase-related protein [Dissulfurispiraceae bacterium]
MAKALALYSGGLDSTLAILVMLRQGVRVNAITFQTGFGCYQTEAFFQAALATAERFGFELIIRDIVPQFIDIIRTPKFGFGKNMNPCLDCKILMLREAKKLMSGVGADFIVTGEVLWQRPMSQRKDTLAIIDRESGLKGYVLRPLSAILMKPTIPEELGMVRREKLYAFNGRSRKPQIALAEELGLSDYPQPAGGCLLTDPLYAERLRRTIQESPAARVRTILMLRVGRHFQVAGGVRIVVGRDDKDNAELKKMLADDDYRLFVKDCGSPLTAVIGNPSEADLETAAALTARYSAARKLPTVSVTVEKNGRQNTLAVTPAADDLIGRLRA